jgi:hypothetical protein
MSILKVKHPTNLVLLQTVCALESEEKIQDADAKEDLAGDAHANCIASTIKIETYKRCAISSICRER